MRKNPLRRSIVECSRLEARQLLCTVHEMGSIGVFDEEVPGSTRTRPPVSGDLVDQINVPAYSSRPGASKKLYLDFNGHASFDNWSGWWEFGGHDVPATPAYDLDDNQLSFSYLEKKNIEEIWKGVAEKFSPFDLDVTTVKPSSLSPGNTAYIIVGGDGAWLGRGGGVAQVGGFNEGFFDGNSGNYAFVWANPDDTAYVAEAVAHEAGHVFNLYHQSTGLSTTSSVEYASNFIMGRGDRTDWGRWGSTVEAGTIATTRDGDTVSKARDSQDDLVRLTSDNGFGYRPDDFGNTTITATTLSLTNSSGLQTGSTSGVILPGDADMIRINHAGGSLEAELLSAEFRGMLDPQLALLNAGGSIIENSAQDDASDGKGEKITFNTLTVGTYYLWIRSEGGYGNIGQWRLNVRAGGGSTVANNSLGSALTIGLQGDTGATGVALGFGGNATIPESVQTTDVVDFFKVRLPKNVRSLFAQISGQTTSVDVQFIKDLNGNFQVDNGEVFAASAGGTGTQSISLTDVAASDVIYVRTRNLGGGTSNYTLKLSSDIGVASLPPSVESSFFDPAPYHGGMTIYDAIMPAAGDTVDYYRVKPQFAGQLGVYLFETGGNVVFTVGNDTNNNGVLDTGEFILSANNTNDFPDLFNVPANANILIRVSGGVEANYNIFAMMDYPSAGNNTGALTGAFVVPAGNSGTFNEYLGYAGDNYDTYKFNPVAGLFHAKLTMTEPLPAHRLQIIQDSNTNGVVDAGEIVADGFGELTYNITTFANYYMRVLPAPAGEFGTTGNYRLAWWMGNAVEPPSAAPAPITPGSSNQTVNGYLGFNALEASLTDTEDRYQFTLASRTRFDVSLNTAQLGLQILQSSGNVLARIAGVGTNEGTISSLSVNLDPGTYILRTYLPVAEREDQAISVDYTMTYKTAAITDNTPPAVSSSGMQYEVKSTGVYFVMNQDVAGSVQLEDASVVSLDNGFLFPLRRAYYEQSSRTVGFDFLAPVLPDGRYRATLKSGSVKDLSNNPMVGDYTFDFYVLAGDFNRDQVVNFDDLLRVAQNYGKVDTATYSMGDIDYDRSIDFDDLLMFAQKYGNSLFSASVIGAEKKDEERAVNELLV